MFYSCVSSMSREKHASGENDHELNTMQQLVHEGELNYFMICDQAQLRISSIRLTLYHVDIGKTFGERTWGGLCIDIVLFI